MKLTEQEEAYVAQMVTRNLQLHLGDLPEVFAGRMVGCACVGGLTPGGPCHCALAEEALRRALAVAGLRQRPPGDPTPAMVSRG